MLNRPLQPVTGNGKHSSKSRPTRAKRTAPRRQSASPVQIGGSAAPALAALPILPASLPTEYVIPVGLQRSAEIALGMLDAGLLTHTDPSLSPSMMVEQSMAEWFARITSDLNWLEVNLAMSADHENLHYGLDDDSIKSYFGIEGDEALHFGVTFGGWHWFTLKEKVEALEAKVEGLGETAIHWLDKHIFPLCTAVTPNFTFYAAQHAYWYGEDDESTILEENEGDEDTDIYRRADFDASFPKLSYEAGEKLDKAALQGLLSHPDREVASLAAMLLEPEVEDEVRGTYLQQFADDHLPVMEPAICLAWAEKDDSVQIVDDYFNYEMECGNGTDVHTMWAVENSAEGIAKAVILVEKFVTELKKIEAVLSLVATRNDNI